jgi:hypothetical protein
MEVKVGVTALTFLVRFMAMCGCQLPLGLAEGALPVLILAEVAVLLLWLLAY